MPRKCMLGMLGLCCLLLLAASSSKALQVGDPAPPFALPATTADRIALADFLGKQPVVVFFFIGAFTSL
ncbi:MAG: hypothetical protein KatS3mg131_1580 [Candidatus Tectimicrobiota bacterium]|nr:MAG: hypothetical protein KatS3mg131_1580 [Candidatus Tectomicrobia bacterium]